MNDTLRILSGLALKLQRSKKNPQWEQAEETYDRLQSEFRAAHCGTPALLHQTDDLLFAQGLLCEQQAEFQFLLGLQMGLELGSLELLKDTQEGEITFRPSP
ncbi:MAG: hypothetical protein Q4C45_11960 [Oscillospiraceae bacterium]|nr:hypothetical protein [Oscillospiraceae bacterium]